MQLDQLLSDGKTQSEPAVAAGRRAVLLGEAIEDVRQVLCRNADPGVAHTELQVGVDPLQQRLERGRLWA